MMSPLWLNEQVLCIIYIIFGTIKWTELMQIVLFCGCFYCQHLEQENHAVK